MLIIKQVLLMAICLLMAIANAQAKWYEASSDHFVIISNKKEKSIRKFAERLERYHGAMQWFYGRADTKPSPSNRVTIYVVKRSSDVRKLYSGNSKYVRGFYIGKAGGSLAVTAPLSSKGSAVSDSEQVLLHEYAHHFLANYSARGFPRWVEEGYAEFFSSAKFEKNGNVGLGLPAYHRAYELWNSKEVPIELLLDTAAYKAKKGKSKRYDAFYGRSWLLFHYLQFSTDRRSQLNQYLKVVASGVAEIEAAQSVFGDLQQLDDELDAYQKQRQLQYLTVRAKDLSVGEIRTRQLRPGESIVLSSKIELELGMDQKELADLLPSVRKTAQLHPDEPAVHEVLSRIELGLGRIPQALAAANQAIALDPSSVSAQIYKGNAMSAQALKDNTGGDANASAWSAVRKQYIEANKLEHDNPLSLMNFYRTYLDQAIPPTKNAIAALIRALELAPYDGGLRLMVGVQYANAGELSHAINTLKPLANSPHQNKYTTAAQKLLEAILTVEEKLD